MTVVRVDAEAERKLERLQGMVDEVQSDADTLVTQGEVLANESDWGGGDRSKWISHWEGDVAPTLDTIGKQLKDVATAVQNLAIGIRQAGGGY